MSLKILFISLMLLPIYRLSAAEQKAEAPRGEEAEGGEKKDGKIPVDEKPWVAIQAKIAGLTAKRHGLEHDLDEIFKKKKTVSPDSSEMHALVKESEEKYKSLAETKEDEEKQIRILQFRYPERAAGSKVKVAEGAEKKELPSLETMEKEKTTKDDLQENYELMKRQYKK